MEITQFVFLVILLTVCILLLVMLLLRRSDGDSMERIEYSVGRMRKTLFVQGRRSEASQARLRTEVSGNINESMRVQNEQISSLSGTVNEQMNALTGSVNDRMDSLSGTMDKRLDSLTGTVNEQLAAMTGTMNERMDRMADVMNQKLDQIAGVVDQKLDNTLNRRLDENFRQVGDQLGKLYQSLGELEKLSAGVGDLNRTLTNVKTRGVFGEVQLGRILADTMASSQYDTNVATREGSPDRVEFAIRFPAQDGSDEVVYLPIDAKFPSDIYNRIVDASANGDPAGVEAARKELRQRIRGEARDIREKYLDVPRTTAYAILFLPTEGLYAEVLRIDGLTEECQKDGVIVAGPTTITALLNSLQMGFRNIALSKKSVEVMRLLEAVKAQFDKMDSAIEKTLRKLNEAEKATDDMRNRTRIIRRQMQNIGEMDKGEAKRILGGAVALPEEPAPTE